MVGVIRRFPKGASVAAALAVGALTLGPAVALGTEGAHFKSASASVANNGALVVSWDEAGVGNATVDYSMTAQGTATYGCINGGGNHPKASNKETVNGPVAANGSFPATKNGRVTGSLSAGPPSAGSFSCPSGQTFALISVSYSGITLTDTTNNVTANIGSVSRTFLNVK